MGKVLYIGISDAPAWVVAQANTLATLRGWTPFIGLQIEYSLKQRTPERELLPMAQALDIGVLPWSPLGGGVLTGKYNRPASSNTETGRLSNPQIATVNERDLAIAEVVLQVAEEIGCTPSQVALSWIRQQAGGLIPVIGARTVEQVQDNLGCLNVTLSHEQMERLNQVSAIELGFPHDFFKSTMVQEFSFAGTLSKID
jgi:aryl-alcohol dehydrogenase-like predicted oxidoreductase